MEGEHTPTGTGLMSYTATLSGFEPSCHEENVGLRKASADASNACESCAGVSTAIEVVAGHDSFLEPLRSGPFDDNSLDCYSPSGKR